MAKQTKGLCKYCGKEYARAGMIKHLAAHNNRDTKVALENENTKCGYFELVISDWYNTDYWLIVEIKETATLKDLDKFIRDIWVECCGHLSSYEIDEVVYEAYPEADDFFGREVKSMNCKVKDVCTVGQIINYEYDFGSTTKLEIKVQGYRIGTEKEESITLLSRNNPPEILCSQCGVNRAKWIHPEIFYSGNGCFCEECLRENGIEDEEDDDVYELEELTSFEEYYLPVCNSPRMGVCGYDGSRHYPDQFVPDDK